MPGWEFLEETLNSEVEEKSEKDSESTEEKSQEGAKQCGLTNGFVWLPPWLF